jgi:serine/threonine-protein kinase
MRLVIVGGPVQGGPFPLSPGPNTIGRAPDCTVSLPSPAVSRVHAIAFLKDGHVRVTDRGSANGLLDGSGNMVGELVLEHGDEVIVGPIALRFEDPEQELELAEGHDDETAEAEPDTEATASSAVEATPAAAAPAPGSSILPGELLDGRYRVKAELGRGGFATVYLVEHVALGSEHAVKVLHPQLRDDADLRQRFLREGKIQAALRHPNVVAVTDVVVDPVPGLVLDYVQGETLDEYLQELGRPASAAEIGAILGPIVDAVETAHEAGVVHRDLKPENIILARRGPRVVPTLTDFGIAKVQAASGLSSASRETRVGTRMGTLQYASPEQIRGEPVDARADIFALGAILYEMACGTPAFPDDNDYDLMRRIVDADYESPLRLNPAMGRPLARCIRDALEPDPERRTASCAVFKRGLLRGLASRGRVTGPIDEDRGVAAVVVPRDLDEEDATRQTSLTPRDLLDHGLARLGDRLRHLAVRSRASGGVPAFDDELVIELAAPTRRGFRWVAGGGRYRDDGKLATANGIVRAAYRANGADYSGNANQVLVFAEGVHEGRTLDALYQDLRDEREGLEIE